MSNLSGGMSGVERRNFAKNDLRGLLRLGEGGQGDVYEVANVRIQHVAGTAFKQYNSDSLEKLDHKVLEAMAEFPGSLSYEQGMRLYQLAAWPAFTVSDAGMIVGFLMPKVPDTFFFERADVDGAVERKLAEAQWLLNKPGFLANRGIALSDQKRFLLIREAAAALTFFHSNEITVGDFSAKNILFNIDAEPKVYFIDCDSMTLKGWSALPQVNTPGWVRPNKNEPMATVASDTYKFGLFALRLFTGEQDSASVKLLPKSVPRRIKGLIDATLRAEKPSERPPLDDWLDLASAAANRASKRVPKKKSLPTSSLVGQRRKKTGLAGSVGYAPQGSSQAQTPKGIKQRSTLRGVATSAPTPNSISFITKLSGVFTGLIFGGSFGVAVVSVYGQVTDASVQTDMEFGFVAAFVVLAASVLGIRIGTRIASSYPGRIQLIAGGLASAILFWGYSSQESSTRSSVITTRGPVATHEVPVTVVQELLKKHGYDVGTIDGKIGPRTTAAVRKYQRDAGIAADGQVTNQLLTSLRQRPIRVVVQQKNNILPNQVPRDRRNKLLTENRENDARTMTRVISTIVSQPYFTKDKSRLITLTDVSVGGMNKGEIIYFDRVRVTELNLKFGSGSAHRAEEWVIKIEGRAKSGIGNFARRIECRDRKAACELFFQELSAALATWRREYPELYAKLNR